MSTRRLAALLACAVATALVACASYRAPENGPLATLVFEGKVTTAYIMEDGTCRTRRSLPNGTGQRINVRAESPVSIEVRMMRSDAYEQVWCNRVLTFVPSNGGTYTLRLNDLKLEKLCVFEIKRLDLLGVGTDVEGLSYAEPPSCF